MDDSRTLLEIRDLLLRVVQLLEPVADNYDEQYRGRLEERRKVIDLAIRKLLSTPPRKKAWVLADGSRNQAKIAREARLDPAETSRLFKELKALGVMDPEATNPTKNVELLDDDANA